VGRANRRAGRAAGQALAGPHRESGEGGGGGGGTCKRRAIRRQKPSRAGAVSAPGGTCANTAGPVPPRPARNRRPCGPAAAGARPTRSPRRRAPMAWPLGAPSRAGGPGPGSGPRARTADAAAMAELWVTRNRHSVEASRACGPAQGFTGPHAARGGSPPAASGPASAHPPPPAERAPHAPSPAGAASAGGMRGGRPAGARGAQQNWPWKGGQVSSGRSLQGRWRATTKSMPRATRTASSSISTAIPAARLSTPASNHVNRRRPSSSLRPPPPAREPPGARATASREDGEAAGTSMVRARRGAAAEARGAAQGAPPPLRRRRSRQARAACRDKASTGIRRRKSDKSATEVRRRTSWGSGRPCTCRLWLRGPRAVVSAGQTVSGFR
jgi:hypothetical protein